MVQKCRIENIAFQVGKFCIVTCKLLLLSAQDRVVTKSANFTKLYIPCFTACCNKIWNLYNFKTFFRIISFFAYIKNLYILGKLSIDCTITVCSFVLCSANAGKNHKIGELNVDTIMHHAHIIIIHNFWNSSQKSKECV